MSSGYITHEDGTISPDVIEEYEVVQTAGNIIHPILGRADPDVTFRPAGLRTGTLALSFALEADAEDARAAHATGTVFTLIAPDRPTLEMVYVLAGTLTVGRVAAGRWIVTLEFQEVEA